MCSPLFALSLYCLVATVLTDISSTSNESEIEKSGNIIVDLSHEIVQGNPRIPLLTEFEVNHSATQLKGENNFVKYETLTIATHYGTHMDTPCHLKEGAWCLDDIPFERLVLVPVAVINVTSKVFPPDSSPQRDYQITVQDITDWETQHHQQVPNNGVVLFYTDWQRYWDEPLLYAGGDTFATLHFPGLSPEGAQWLVTNRPKLYGVGIDSLSIDYGQSQDLLSHNYLTGASMYIFENVVNLNLLPVTGARINVGVMKLGKNATGAPARILAMYPA